MPEQGVQHLIAVCLNDSCRHSNAQVVPIPLGASG
jgi:hypothetical protein